MAKQATKAKAKVAAQTKLVGLCGALHAEHAERILDALHKLNTVIEETAKQGTLVSIKTVMASKCVQLECTIYCRTHTTVTLEVKMKDAAA